MGSFILYKKGRAKMKFFKKYMLLYNSDMKSRKHSTYPIRLNIQYPAKPGTGIRVLVPVRG